MGADFYKKVEKVMIALIILMLFTNGKKFDR